MPSPNDISLLRRDPFQPGMLAEFPGMVEKIVILRASRIGDFINASPAFRALRQHFPTTRIDLITLPMLFELADRLDLFNHLIPFPGYPGLAEQFFSPASTLDFFTRMQAEKYSLAVQMQGSGVYSNPFVLMLGAVRTAGFIREGDSPGLLDAALPFPPLHEAMRNIKLVEFLGVPAGDPFPEFPLRADDHMKAQKILDNAPRPWIGIHTSARDSTRRWPVARFAQAALQIQKHYGGTIMLFGDEADRDVLQETPRSGSSRMINLAGRTSLPVTGALILRLNIFLTNDTGPAHIAYALNTPTVTIFGGGDPARNGPITCGPFRILAYPVPCRPCETGQCLIGLHCLESISVETVVQAATEIIRLE